MRYFAFLFIVPLISGCLYFARITPDGNKGYIVRSVGLGSMKANGLETKSELINLQGLNFKQQD